jgi:type II/III secretion system protein
MTCEDYLSMLATLPVEELAYGGARDHAGRCRECDRITRVVAERERNMLMAFGDLHLSVPAGQIAAHALVTSRRRTVTLYKRIGLGVATVASILYVFMSRQVPAPSPSADVRETFQLQCLSPEQAAEVLRPLIQATGRVSFRANSPLGIITVEASPEEMERARSVLERYDTPTESQCAVQSPVPRVLRVP